MHIMPILAFLPQETIPVIAIAGAFALIFGMRGIASMLFSLCGIMIILPTLLEPILDMLPEWALHLLIAVFWISIVVMIVGMLIGKGATDHMIGTLASDFVKWVLIAPFRLLKWFFRGVRP